MRTVLLTAAILFGGAAQAQQEFGFAGLLDNRNQSDLEPITMASGQPLAEEPYELKSGGYYNIEIVADGSAEIALGGAEFFRAVWVDEVVINDLEVRPLGLATFEFDDAGTIELSFIAIVPGTYELRIPGTTGDTQRAVFNIR